MDMYWANIAEIIKKVAEILTYSAPKVRVRAGQHSDGIASSPDQILGNQRTFTQGRSGVTAPSKLARPSPSSGLGSKTDQNVVNDIFDFEFSTQNRIEK